MTPPPPEPFFQPAAASECGAPRWLLSSIAEYETMYRRSIDDPAGFWGDVANELHWFKPFDSVVDFEAPDATWFTGGTTNLCYNCVDRHVDAGHGKQIGIVWEGEPVGDTGPEIRNLTYAEIQEQTATFANALKSKGVKKGDVVTIYMGMVPELAIAVLACVRIGAVHSVIFGGFSASAIADRVIDASSKVIVTCDGAWRRGSVVPLKANVDEAVKSLGEQGHTLDACVVVKRCGNDVAMASHESWWHQDMATANADCPCEPVESEHMSFLLYTSGSTGKPKGIQHTTGGYMVYTYLTSKYVFNLIPDLDTPKRDAGQPGQLYWCTADVGWITGHSYIIYGIMANRVPTLMYEGAPNYPDASRFWDMVERHKVTQFYTAPTAIRAFMKWGDEHVEKHDL
ncbi:MAG: AMP-binding protein, partial [Planctomycetota bacterium]